MFLIYFFLCVKMTTNYLYEEDKDEQQKKALDRYQNLPEEDKEKKRQYHRELNKNLSEEQKKK